MHKTLTRGRVTDASSVQGVVCRKSVMPIARDGSIRAEP